jgi:hypothetical protein
MNEKGRANPAFRGTEWNQAYGWIGAYLPSCHWLMS